MPGNQSKVTRHERNRKMQLTMRGKNIYRKNPKRIQMLEAADKDSETTTGPVLLMFNVKWRHERHERNFEKTKFNS